MKANIAPVISAGPPETPRLALCSTLKITQRERYKTTRDVQVVVDRDTFMMRGRSTGTSRRP